MGICLLMLSNGSLLQAQNDVMLQAFYWDVPVDAANNNGHWWDNLYNKADDFKEIGITGIWIPSPAKGNWGIYDMGYGIYDHYDLGDYNQKGSVETRFGSRQELQSMISAMHDTSNGKPKVEVYADIILNHMYSSDEDAEVNPAVKQYVFDEAYRNGQQYVPIRPTKSYGLLKMLRRATITLNSKVFIWIMLLLTRNAPTTFR